MLELLIISILIAVTVHVFVRELTDEGMIFGWYGKFLDKLNPYIANPLGGCDKCFGGQIALFFYIFYTNEYNLIIHIFFISLTIIFIKCLKRI